MRRILLVKTSSLGDVVHNFPVVSDIVRAHPGARIDWVVEESFAALPRLHPMVGLTLPVAVRRWRSRLHEATTWREMSAFARDLASRPYDAVIDTQGLLKSALIARIARGRRYGLGFRASREPLFAFYHRTFDVPRTLHAVERNRSLAARALGYALDTPPDYGIRAVESESRWRAVGRYAVLLHATSARAKLWPEARWIELGERLRAQGLVSVLPWGSAEERARSERLAAAIGQAVVPPRLALEEAAPLLAGARCAIGVDTGLTHLAGALGVATVGIYLATDPAATGLYGCPRAVSLGRPGACPDAGEVADAVQRLAA